MKRLLFGILFFVSLGSLAQAQYYSPYYYRRAAYGYNAYGYNANAYLRAGMANTRRFYSLGSANAYLRAGMVNTRYFYGY